MLITFEGLDCSGKTTQAKLLAESLEKMYESGEGPAVLFIREPGGTELSEKIRFILLDVRNSGMSDATELFLFSAARAQLVREVIKPALQRGEIVICDRFYDSTTAYQGWGRGIDLEGVKKINTIATAGLVPDLTFYLDIDLDELQKRISLVRPRQMSMTSEKEDRMESSGKEFFNRVRRGYLELARAESHRFVVLDGKEAVSVLQEKIWNEVRHCLRIPKNKLVGGS